MADNDEVWRWDDSRAVEYKGADAREHAAAQMMEWTGATSPEEAADMLLGRPSLAERGREKSEVLHFKAPASMAAYVRTKSNRSEYLRMLIARDMREHDGRRQAARS